MSNRYRSIFALHASIPTDQIELFKFLHEGRISYEITGGIISFTNVTDYECYMLKFHGQSTHKARFLPDRLEFTNSPYGFVHDALYKYKVDQNTYFVKYEIEQWCTHNFESPWLMHFTVVDDRVQNAWLYFTSDSDYMLYNLSIDHLYS
jgi:hypothetical protein